MPSRDSAARPVRRKPLGLRDRAPAGWSVALHAVLLAAAAVVPWSQRQFETPPRMEVVWVREWPAEIPPRPEEPERPERPERPQEEPRAERAPPDQPRAEPSPRREQPQTEQARADRARLEDSPVPRAAPPEAVPSSPPESSAAPPEAVPSNTPESRASNAPTTGHAPAPRRGNIDWEAERRLAIQQLSRELERENRFPTFSFNDIVPKSPAKEADPLEHLFDGGGGGPPSGRSVLGVGQAKTKVGRFLSNLCNALTGGASVFGLMSICARDTTGPYAASPLRPEYLKKLPVCEDVAVTSPRTETLAANIDPAYPNSPPTGTGAAGEAGTSSTTLAADTSSTASGASAASTIKCRLLTEAERAEYWKNAAERLQRDDLVTAPNDAEAREDRLVPQQ